MPVISTNTAANTAVRFFEQKRNGTIQFFGQIGQWVQHQQSL